MTTESKPSPRAMKAAEEAARALFTNVEGMRGDQLRCMQGPPEGEQKYLGGWGERPAADHIAPIIEQRFPGHDALIAACEAALPVVKSFDSSGRLREQQLNAMNLLRAALAESKQVQP